jgi:hypothetical protein
MILTVTLSILVQLHENLALFVGLNMITYNNITLTCKLFPRLAIHEYLASKWTASGIGSNPKQTQTTSSTCFRATHLIRSIKAVETPNLFHTSPKDSKPVYSTRQQLKAPDMFHIFSTSERKAVEVREQCSKAHPHKIISVHQVPYKPMQHTATPSVTTTPSPKTQTNPISWI